MTMRQRYDRQMRIPEWDQQAIETAVLTIVGHNTFSEYLALAGSALGIGTIRIVATPYDKESCEALLLRLSSGKSREERLAEMIENIGLSRFEYVKAHMKSKDEDDFLYGSVSVVDASGRDEARALSLNYAINEGRACELVHFYDGGFLLIGKSGNPLQLYEKQGCEADTVCARIAAGAALEEAKKSVFGESVDPVVTYEFPNNASSGENYSGISVLVVGGGALGEKLVTELAGRGMKRIDVMDPDTIEETNIGRQLIYFGSVGAQKATVLAKRSGIIRGDSADYSPVVCSFDEQTDVKGYDIVFDCVDNFETRLLISRKCAEAKVPLVSGGTNYKAGQVVTYNPGKTSCPNHVLDIENILNRSRLEKEEQQHRGCIWQPEPSVIMSNEVTAGMMVNGMRTLVHPEIFGRPLNGQVRYDAEIPERFGTIELAESCGD